MKVLVVLFQIIGASLCLGGGKHLFILSGQSNMVGMDPEVSFIPLIAKTFGKEQIIVVKKAFGGQSIRSWVKLNHEFPPPQGGKVPKVRGNLYKLFIDAVKLAIKGEKLETVTFVWMQGESDLNNRAYDTYLRELLKQIREDVGFNDINVVIGRISDSGLDQKKRLEGRKRMRRVQVEYAEAHPRGAWVDTDDLNDSKRKDGSIHHGLHYTKEGYVVLGRRFAQKSVDLILRAKAK